MAEVEVSLNPQAIELVDQLPLFMQREAARNACLAAARVVAKEAKRRAPSGKRTGTSKLQSDKTKTSRKKTFKATIKAFKHRSLIEAHAGAPLAHLLEHGHKAYYWGHESSDFVKGQPIFRPAIDTTAAQQEEAIVTKLSSEIDKHVQGYTG